MVTTIREVTPPADRAVNGPNPADLHQKNPKPQQRCPFSATTWIIRASHIRKRRKKNVSLFFLSYKDPVAIWVWRRLCEQSAALQHMLDKHGVWRFDSSLGRLDFPVHLFPKWGK